MTALWSWHDCCEGRCTRDQFYAGAWSLVAPKRRQAILVLLRRDAGAVMRKIVDLDVALRRMGAFWTPMHARGMVGAEQHGTH